MILTAGRARGLVSIGVITYTGVRHFVTQSVVQAESTSRQATAGLSNNQSWKKNPHRTIVTSFINKRLTTKAEKIQREQLSQSLSITINNQSWKKNTERTIITISYHQ